MGAGEPGITGRAVRIDTVLGIESGGAAHNFSEGMMNDTDAQSQSDSMLSTTNQALNGDRNDPNDGIMGDVYQQAKERLGW